MYYVSLLVNGVTNKARQVRTKASKVASKAATLFGRKTHPVPIKKSLSDSPVTGSSPESKPLNLRKASPTTPLLTSATNSPLVKSRGQKLAAELQKYGLKAHQITGFDLLTYQAPDGLGSSSQFTHYGQPPLENIPIHTPAPQEAEVSLHTAEPEEIKLLETALTRLSQTLKTTVTLADLDFEASNLCNYLVDGKPELRLSDLTHFEKIIQQAADQSSTLPENERKAAQTYLSLLGELSEASKQLILKNRTVLAKSFLPGGRLFVETCQKMRADPSKFLHINSVHKYQSKVTSLIEDAKLDNLASLESSLSAELIKLAKASVAIVRNPKIKRQDRNQVFLKMMNYPEEAQKEVPKKSFQQQKEEIMGLYSGPLNDLSRKKHLSFKKLEARRQQTKAWKNEAFSLAAGFHDPRKFRMRINSRLFNFTRMNCPKSQLHTELVEALIGNWRPGMSFPPFPVLKNRSRHHILSFSDPAKIELAFNVKPAKRANYEEMAMQLGMTNIFEIGNGVDFRKFSEDIGQLYEKSCLFQAGVEAPPELTDDEIDALIEMELEIQAALRELYSWDSHNAVEAIHWLKTQEAILNHYTRQIPNFPSV